MATHPPAPAPHIRTFHARHGRVRDHMVAALRDLGPGRALAARRDHDRPLVLEVGCGHGEAALAFATAHPHHDVLAVDVHTPGVARLLQEAHARSVGNVFVEHADAIDVLVGQLGPGSLAGVHLFFPDPWPKSRHRKRRFVRDDVLDLLADRMQPHAALRIATDIVDYADWAGGHLERHRCFEAGEAARPSWRPVTGYEAKARAAGRPVVELVHHRLG